MTDILEKGLNDQRHHARHEDAQHPLDEFELAVVFHKLYFDAADIPFGCQRISRRLGQGLD